MSEAEKEDSPSFTIELNAGTDLELDNQRCFNGGYLFLQQIYHELGLDKISKAIQARHDFQYNLNSILSRLLYTRILFPSSKLSTYKDSFRFIEQPDFELQHAVKDYTNQGKWKEKTLPGEEFIRRFLMHVPPKRFVRIRHYGLLASRNKSKNMTHCRNLLGCKKYISQLKNLTAVEMIKQLYNIDVCKCASCGGKMLTQKEYMLATSRVIHMRC